MFATVIAAFRATIQKFHQSESGNVAMIFGIAAIPVILSVGGFIDYQRTTVARAQMQDALDATALALHTDAATMTQAQMNDFATKYFAANFSNLDALNVVVTPVYDASGPTVTVKGTAKVNQAFLPLIGIKEIDIAAKSVTTWGQARLRVALVLDNTGSMSSSGKMTALKTATKNLLNQLKVVATNPGDVYVSIIPFSKDVNAGAAAYTNTWVRWDVAGDDKSWDGANGTCNISGKTPRSVCTAAGKCSITSKTSQSTCQAAGKCSKSQYTTQTKCQQKNGTWSTGVWTVGVWTHANHNTWNGCIMDRDQDYDTKNTAPVATATLFPAQQYSNCPGSMMGLSYDWTALASEVDAMYPNGSTNQTIGLAWGWQSLTAAPFTVPAFDPAYQYKTIMILLTDGLNTQDRWYGDGYNVSTQVNDREKILCQNVRDANITLYTIQVNTGGDATSTLLQDCATTTDKFFILTTADQIITTFDEIGKALSDLRLSS